MSEAYKVGIEIAMAGNFASALKDISRSLLGIKGQVDEIGKGIKGWGEVAAGLTGILAGVGLGKFVADLASANGELQRQVDAFRLAGNSVADAVKAQQAAYQASAQTPFYGVTDAMKIGRELAGNTQDNAGAAAILPKIISTAAKMAISTGQNDIDLQPLFKAIDLRQGAIDEANHRINPEAFANEFDWMARMIIAGQGQIKPQDILNFIKQAGPMAKDMAPEQLWKDYAGAIEDMGGARTGTAATAMGRQIKGGIMLPKVADTWLEYGMLTDEGWSMVKGHVSIDDPTKAIKGYSQFASGDIPGFMNDVVKPNLAAHGKTSNQDINDFMYRFASTETARRMYSTQLTGGVFLENVAKRLGMIQLGGEGDDIVKGDYQGGAHALGESIHTLATALGDAAGVAPMLNKLAGGIAGLAQTIANHPIIGQIATWGGGAAAVGATVGGTALFAKGVKDLWGGGLTGSAAALNTSAVMLQEAAIGLGAKGIPGVGGAAAGGAGFFSNLFKGISAFGGLISLEALANTTTAHEDQVVATGAKLSQAVRSKYGDSILQAARSAFQPWYKHTFRLDAEDGDDQKYIDQYLKSGGSLRDIAGRYPQGASGVSRFPNAGWAPPSSGGKGLS